LLNEVQELLESFGGVIFTGPPGTSKTYYASKIGEALVSDDQSRIRYIQFHPSYQYEDFMQGFAPREDGDGFALQPKIFLRMCRAAEVDSNQNYVLVIDELSRGDSGRIFGEALTYVEKSKRGLEFELASGEACVIPPNLIILATMNESDRGVDEVDAAFERRFARIAMEPSREILNDMLEGNGVQDDLRRRIVGFFNMINGKAKINPQGRIGHTYFRDVRDARTLASLWDHQLRFVVEKAYRLDPATRDDIESGWTRLLASAEEASSGEPRLVSDSDGSQSSERTDGS
jgi:5-methylcytosine-specific restriction protein B